MTARHQSTLMPSAPAAATDPREARRRAFRWAAALISLLAILALLLRTLLQHSPDPFSMGPTTLTTSTASRQELKDIPLSRFTEVTGPAGLTFVHRNGAYGEKLLPETMGGGVAFFDFDADGDPDLLFVGSCEWPWRVQSGLDQPSLALYRNDGTGHFTDVTAGSGLDVVLYGMGVAVGDYDNDGWVDVFITAVADNRLFRNLGGGRFQEVTREAGIRTAPTDWCTSSAWLDIDNDGDLDLFVCNYVQWTREIDFQANYQLAGIGRAYGQPMNFPGTFPYLYRNDGGGRFTDISARAGVQLQSPATGVPMAKSLGVAPVDLNNDGWIDLVVANDTVQNFVLSNQHNGTFREIGAQAGIAFDSFGQTRGAMGIDAARFRNDDTLGIAIGNFANEMNALYVSRPETLLFADEAVAEGMGHASQSLLKFGLFFFDYDLDGHLDILTANGHLENDINQVQRTQQYRQPAQLFWNRGNRPGVRFLLVPPEKCGPDLFRLMVGRGSAYADIDGDGDLDAVISQIGGSPMLLRNDQQLSHNWIRIRLVGTRSNRDAIGAWVQVRLGNQVLARQVMPTKGYLSQSELPVTFGLGKLTRVDEVAVFWPGGHRQQIGSVTLNQTTVILETP
jgi:hypothetical protein